MYQANWELVVVSVDYKSGDDGYRPIYIMSIHVVELQFEMKIEVCQPHEKTCVILTGKKNCMDHGVFEEIIIITLYNNVSRQ